MMVKSSKPKDEVLEEKIKEAKKEQMEKVNESVDISYTQLQNQVKQEREDKEYYRNVCNSLIEYLDAEATQMNQNRQIFKKALLNNPSSRTKVNPPENIDTNKVIGNDKQEDNKNKKKKK
jgi:hypothetical protein